MCDPLIVIPARGGSQGIPRKALVKICDRPLIWYTLDYVRRLGLSSRSVVITDDDEIACLTKDFGVVVVREPFVSSQAENSIRATYHAVQAIDRERRGSDIVVLLQPTQPVRPLNVIDRCVAAVHSGADAALTVHAPKFPPELMAKSDGQLIKFRDYRRRQDCPRYYCANGLCYSYRREVFDVAPESLRSFHMDRNYRGVLTDPFPYVDIDDFHDLELFQILVEQGYTIWSRGPAVGIRNQDIEIQGPV